MTSTVNKEQVYDNQISPLMTQILNVCQANGIAVIAQFVLNSPETPDLHCTSILPDETGVNPLRHKLALAMIDPVLAATPNTPASVQ
jgi:hypothetical protein